MPLDISSVGGLKPTDGGYKDFPKDIKYNYPGGIDLRPDSDLHKKLLTAIMSRVQLSHNKMSNRYQTWRELDSILTSYVKFDKKDLEAKKKNKPPKVVVPVSYAILETLRTYLVQAFLRDPIFRYEGMSSEDITGAMLLEKVISRQVKKARMSIHLNTMFRNSIVYGIGMVTPIWSVKEGFASVDKEEGFISRITGAFNSTGSTKIREKRVAYEGNELHTIDPYKYYPDVNVASWDIPKMEFVGWLRNDNRMNILNEEKNSEGTIFNAKFLNHVSGISQYGQDESKRDKDSVSIGNRHDHQKNEVDRIYLYWNLIPSEWGLPGGDYPEKWLFSVAGDSVILQANPINLDHDEFPVVCCSPDGDGLTATPIGKLETIQGLQNLINFEINSRISNVINGIEGKFLVDPSRVNINDVLDAEKRIIRTREQSWGKGLNDSIEQLQVTDYTADNIAIAFQEMEMVEKATGAVDILQGLYNSKERTTATEIETVSGGALSRLETSALLAGVQAMQPLGHMLASQTQQFMSSEQYIQVLGRNETDLAEIFQDDGGDSSRVRVDPKSILVDYDVEVRDGSLPDKGSPEIWTRLYNMILQNPETAREINTVKIFKYIATLLGADNIGDFVRDNPEQPVEVASDEDVAREVERGNLTPTGTENAR